MFHDDHQILVEKKDGKLTDSQVRTQHGRISVKRNKKREPNKTKNLQKKVCKIQIVELKTSISQSICQPVYEYNNRNVIYVTSYCHQCARNNNKETHIYDEHIQLKPSSSSSFGQRISIQKWVKLRYDALSDPH